MKNGRKPFILYDENISFESSLGGLKIYLPTKRGYAIFSLTHTVNKERNADVYRLGQAFAKDGEAGEEYPITPERAEWDMAISLSGRPDFIGGFAHGDEKMTEARFLVDGEAVEIEELSEKRFFDCLKIEVESVGYDPLDGISEVLLHRKEYTVTEKGIRLSQRVEWLGEYLLEQSYLAMMPPSKSVTDSLFTDNDPTVILARSGLTVSSARSATVFGEKSGFYFRMSVPKYPSLTGGDKFFMTDNGGNGYNKMYFPLCNGYEVKKGEVFDTVTEYEIYTK
jgi:hypothetical protein